MTLAPIKTVCVIGLGYIGLPTAGVLASRGVWVIGVDVKEDVIAKINHGEIHIVEPDLEAVTAVAVQRGLLRATRQPQPADAFIIAVPTPLHDGKSDLSLVDAAVLAIAPELRPGNLVVLESTSPPGTTERIAARLAEARPDLRFPPDCGGETCDVNVAYCPERVLPGRILSELVENDRVIGGLTPACAERARQLYKTFCRGECHITNARTAEMCKLTENAFRDVNIAFANELSLIADRLGINVWELIRLANCHPRVNILQPGPGVGGHCIAVDPWFIVEAAPEEARLIRSAREINDMKPGVVLGKIRNAISEVNRRRKKNSRPVVACLGLAFKADVDDLRESPALHIVEQLARAKVCEVVVSEPNISSLPASLADLPGVQLADDAAHAVRQADVVALLVNHRPYRDIERRALAGKAIIDTRGMWAQTA